ncbi:MAG TPA: transporter [Acetobacteraceae bacterium]|nr:transporter [Acetobacteraceae bacterium]
MFDFWSLNRSRAAVLACVLLGVMALFVESDHALAQEVEPKEFVPLPPGSNLALGYYAYGHDTEFTFNNGPTFTKNTGLEVNLAVARYVHYTTVAGHPAGLQMYEFFGSLSGGQIAGQSLGSAFGAQNTVLSAFIWPYADFKNRTYLVLSGFLYPPDGTYDRDSPINVGDGRWRGCFQVGFDKAIGGHFSLDVGFDTMFYGDNDNAFNNGLFPPRVRLSQDNTYRGQVWLNWNFNRAVAASIGWEGFFGGVQYEDGLANGQATKEQRLRASVSTFLSPVTQILLELNHDVQNSGGFKQDFGTTLRFLYAF